MLFVAVATINLQQASVDKWILYAETKGVNNLFHLCKAVNGGFPVNILLNLLGLGSLPRSVDKARYNCIYRCPCSLKLFT